MIVYPASAERALLERRALLLSWDAWAACARRGREGRRAEERRRALEQALHELPKGSAARWEAEASAADLTEERSWRAPLPTRTIEQRAAGRVGVPGSRLLFTSEKGEQARRR